MRLRSSARLGIVGLMTAMLAFAPDVATGQDRPLRAPDGQPDLQGVWNVSTAAPTERPAELADKATLTAEEAAEWEAQIAQQRAALESELSSLSGARAMEAREAAESAGERP